MCIYVSLIDGPDIAKDIFVNIYIVSYLSLYNNVPIYIYILCFFSQLIYFLANIVHHRDPIFFFADFIFLFFVILAPIFAFRKFTPFMCISPIDISTMSTSKIGNALLSKKCQLLRSMALTTFLDEANNFHPSIKFTVEILSKFLDTKSSKLSI